MARKKTPPIRVTIKTALSGRLREVRHELYGDHGGPELARQLDLPARTWYNYETGVTVPAEVLLAFINLTNVDPAWLLTGQGPRYLSAIADRLLAALSPEQLIRRGLEKLEQLPPEPAPETSGGPPGTSQSDLVAVELVPLADLGNGVLPAEPGTHILAYKEWIPHPGDTVATRIEDDSMHPILPPGSVIAVDRSQRDPDLLQGRMVAARGADSPVIRWLELSGRHMILRPNQPSRSFPLIPLEVERGRSNPIIGQVVWSWSRFIGE